VYLSYVVRVGDTVQSIAGSHATTVTDVSNVNAMGSPIVAPGDILAIPLPGKQSHVGLQYVMYGNEIGMKCRGNLTGFLLTNLKRI
jgi:LysM repeat protein